MASAEGAEKMAISVAGKALAYSESAYSVVLSKRETLTPEALKRANQAAAQNTKGGKRSLLWQSEMTEREKVSVHEQQLKGRTMNQFILEIAQADERIYWRSKRTNLYLSLQAALLTPKSANQLLPILLKETPRVCLFKS